MVSIGTMDESKKALKDSILDTHIESAEIRPSASGFVLNIIVRAISYGGSATAASLKDSDEFPTEVVTAISNELCRKCPSGGTDVNGVVLDILKITKNYNWDSKVILALAAFAVSFGDSRLVAQLYLPNPVPPKGMDPLRPPPKLFGTTTTTTTTAGANSKPELDAIHALIRETVDMTRTIFEFCDLSLHDYFTFGSPEIASANSRIPTAVYTTIRSMVTSASQIFSLGTTTEFSTEIATLTSNLNSEKGHLTEIIQRCKNSIKNIREGYELLARTLGSPNIDSSKSLRILFDAPGLYDCYNMKQISNEHLKSKVVALFITDLDPDLHGEEEYAILQQMYLEKWHNPTSRESMYEVVWVPIPNDEWSEEKLKLFKDIREQMEWYSVDDPSKVDKAVIKFAKDNWNIALKPLLVVMDTKGNIVHKNAIYMTCIWGSLAYPFTKDTEDLLCEEMRWSIDLLIDNIELHMDTWIREGKHVCLFGGEDEHWIRMFTNTAKEVANRAGINLELLYVGRSKQKKKLVNIIDIIVKDNLSKTLDWTLIWYFWVRLESMLQLKQRTKSKDIKSNPWLQGVRSLLSYDSKQQNWAMISSGSGEIVMANGENMRRGLKQLRMRKQSEKSTNFVLVLDEAIRKLCPAVTIDYILPTIETMKENQELKAIGRILESAHTNNSRSLDVLFHFKYGQRALYDCANKKRISNNDLERKIVHLFVTDIDSKLPTKPEYKILKQMYTEKLKNWTNIENQFEVVWFPIVDLWDGEKHRLFESLKGQMLWHSVHHPSAVSPVVVRYIKERCNFGKKPILTVISAQGKIAHTNAIHMMCIWGSLAYPFTDIREKSLWEETNWSIDLLAGDLAPDMANWLQKGRYICLYGGEDVEWIRQFTKLAKDVAQESQIVLELLHMGRSKPDENNMTIMDIIRKENLSLKLDEGHISDFWMRLESMWQSKRQVTKSQSTKNDTVMQDITAMLRFRSSKQGWALISKRLAKMVKGTGEDMLKGLADHGWWSWREAEIGFLPALDEYLLEIQLYVSDDSTKKTGEDENVEVLGRIFESSVSIFKPLQVIFGNSNSRNALYDCYNKTTMSIEHLRRKFVAFFITGIEPELIQTLEYMILQEMYTEKRHFATRMEAQYEVIWVPVTDIWTDVKYRQFYTLREHMEWNSIYHPSVVSSVAIRFFKEKWNFANKPILVVIDHQGRIVHNNAIHMICIWGNLAYPFTTIREKALWNEMSWTIDLIMDSVDPSLAMWIQEGRYICLYGGEDIWWIRKFTRIAKDVARESGIVLELLYIGNSKPEEKVTKNIIDLILKENLSRTLDSVVIWYFWLRLESMRHSRGQLTRSDNVNNDLIMQGIIEILSYGSSSQSWVLISRGYSEIVMGNGEHMFKGLAEHGQWRARENEIGFLLALDEHLRKIQLDASHK